MKKFLLPMAALCLVTAYSATAGAQGMIIYPAKGQSPDTQANDQAECGQWATGQTGFNPAAPPPAQAQAAPVGGAVRGGARGALAGAAVGAIAGDAGKGAAIGATAGGLGGAARKRDAQRAADQQNQQMAAQQAAGIDAYNRAVGACMTGRGYTVK
jgi:hypothetical protein